MTPDSTATVRSAARGDKETVEGDAARCQALAALSPSAGYGRALRWSPVRMLRAVITLLLAYLFTACLVLTLIYYTRPVNLLEPARYGPLYETKFLHGLAIAVTGTVFLYLRRRQSAPEWAPKAALLVSILVIGVLIDRFAGIFFPPASPVQSIHQYHARRGWTALPNEYRYVYNFWMRTDEHGLRVDENDPQPLAADAARILFLGDSVTLGFSLTAAEAYGRQTIDLLRARHTNAKLAGLNAGLYGYDTYQEYDWLAHEGMALQPDLVVFQFCLNDVTHPFIPQLSDAPNYYPKLYYLQGPNSVSGIHRGLITAIRRWQYGADERMAAEKLEVVELREALTDAPPPHIERAWERTLHYIGACKKICDQAGIPMVLVIFPVKDQIIQADASDDPQRRLRRFAEAHGLPYVDLLPVYLDHTGTGEDAAELLFMDSVHPTTLGHRLAAETLADHFEASGLLAGLGVKKGTN